MTARSVESALPPAGRRLAARLHAAEMENAGLFNMLARTAPADCRDPLHHLSSRCARRAGALGRHAAGCATVHRRAASMSLFLFCLLFPALALRLMERRLRHMVNGYGVLEREYALMPGAVPAVEADAACVADLSGKDGGVCCFMSAVVLGLNDALVEMTGALAGFTMVLHDNRLIALAGFTTGIAATLSMAASEFFSQKTSSGGQPRMAAISTGIAYFITVILLLLPYMLLPEPIVALAVCMLIAALIILGFTWVDSFLRRTKFWRSFFQMLGVSFGVSIAIFLISWLVRSWFGIEI